MAGNCEGIKPVGKLSVVVQCFEGHGVSIFSKVQFFVGLQCLLQQIVLLLLLIQVVFVLENGVNFFNSLLVPYSSSIIVVLLNLGRGAKIATNASD